MDRDDWNPTFRRSTGMAFVKCSQALQWDVATLQDTFVNVPIAFWSCVLSASRAALLPRHTGARFTRRAGSTHTETDKNNQIYATDLTSKQ